MTCHLDCSRDPVCVCVCVWGGGGGGGGGVRVCVRRERFSEIAMF